MVKFLNLSYEDFIKKYSDKQIICYGAGRTLINFLKVHKEKIELLKKISCIVDSDACKIGNDILVNSKSVKIVSLKDIRLIKNISEKYVFLLLVGNEYILDVLDCLDECIEFDNMVCVYGIQSLQWGWERWLSPYGNLQEINRKQSNYTIPKVIHYCWFGKGAMSQTILECIESWKKFCPDYDIVLWNEDNFNLEKTPQYVRDAYLQGKFAFVSDYVRLVVVYKYGGFYLDTDVELFTSLDVLRNYRAVFCYMEYNEIATGLGFGSIAGTKELKEMYELYNDINFINADGSLNIIPCPRYTNDYFRYWGLRLDNSLKVIDDILFLPSDYFAPLNCVQSDNGAFWLSLYALTERTMGLHKCENSWNDSESIKIFATQKKMLAGINQRLLKDWKLSMEKVNG